MKFYLLSAGAYYPLGSSLSVSERERAIWDIEGRAFPGGVLDQYLCIGEPLGVWDPDPV